MALVTKSFSDIITFTRTSNATQFNSAGTLVYAPHNIVTWSEDFTNAAWVKTNATISGNATTAPNNTLTADQIGIVNDNFTAEVTQTITVIDNITIIFSCYLKYSGEGFNNSVYLSARTKANVFLFSKVINLSTGILSGTGSAETSTSVTDVGSGWYRLVFTVNSIGTGATTPTVGIYADPNPFIGDNFVFAWGAQLNVAALQSYNQTTSSAYYGPRFDYNPSTLAAQGLLIEEQRTNLFQRSEEFNDAYWNLVVSTSVTANATTAPNSTVTADKIVEAAASNVHYLGRNNVLLAAATTCSVSVFAKASERSFIGLQLTPDGTNYIYCTFNLATGVASTPVNAGNGSGATAAISAVGNGWYRCTLSGVPSSTAANPVAAFYVGNANVNLVTSPYLGDGTSGIFLWGAQLEAGAFPTSYIPTTTTPLTRSADVASVNTLSPWFNSVSGTLYAEYAVSGFASASAFPSSAVLSDNTSSNRININSTNTGASLYSYGEVQAGGAPQAGFYGASGSPFGVGTARKVAIAYAANDFAFTTQGLTVQTDTSGNVPTVDRLYLGLGPNGAGQWQNGYLRRITYYPRRLSNAELQAITA